LANICTFLLEHVSEPKKVIDNAYYALKPNGILLIVAPFFERLHKDPEDYWRFTEDGLKRILEKSLL